MAEQKDLWFGIMLIPSFVIYLISMVGETNRAPFDLPEAEGELVGGFHTEYSSLKFALFFLAEYINMVNVAALATTLFLGGWLAPWPLSAIDNGVLNTGWWPVLWFLAKVLLIVFIFVWLRGTLPRLRYDQFMSFGWKILIPVALAWIAVFAGLRVLQNEGIERRELLVGAGVLAVVAIVLALFGGGGGGREAPLAEPDMPAEPREGAFAAYPVPPLPGEESGQPVGVSRAPATGVDDTNGDILTGEEPRA